MNYNLDSLNSSEEKKQGTLAGLRKLLLLIAEERPVLYRAAIAILINSGLNLLGPLLIGHAIDTYIQHHLFMGLIKTGALLFVMYLIALFSSYFQTQLMGGVGQRMLFKLRNSIFNKLQELPVAFFNQNKSGDLISRINNDTDKLNQFFSQSLMQFIGSIVTMVGAGIFLLAIQVKLGMASLIPALIIVIFTRIVSPWVKKKNSLSMKSTGSLSAEIQESLTNFRVIVAFNRRDFFRKRFDDANKQNYEVALKAGLANTIFIPVYGLLTNLAQLIVLAYGIALIRQGNFTIGLLVSYLSYSTNFYNPLRQLAALWANFQVAMAGWDRISGILALESDLVQVTDDTTPSGNSILEFKGVYFSYPDGKEVLHNISFNLEAGKTYAFVGPTGGGKTTTASLIARLYDPSQGQVLLAGKDIRSYPATERAQKIGFILQEPFLFSGTVRENILYGNDALSSYNSEQLEELINSASLGKLLALFDQGLDTVLASGNDSISLGQKQLLAFMRAVLRKPDLLILDEATANIDTMTEQLLGDILLKLPAHTTLVVIAHRLNTIERADQIFFVNSGQVTPAGSLEQAVTMLMAGKVSS